MDINQKTLLAIVKTWRIRAGYSYRGFKCGNCRRFLHRAWHYWLKIGAFKTPVHLCRACQVQLKITYPELKLKTSGLKFNYNPRLKRVFARLISKWNIALKPRYKVFSCDDCQRPIHKAYHLFIRVRARLSEVHLCRNCWWRLEGICKSDNFLL